MKLTSAKPPLEFNYEDAVFLVKAESTEEDRMTLILSGIPDGEHIRFSKSEYCKLLLQRMVVGWRNVTDDKGVPVPYSYDALAMIPKVAEKNLFLELGSFILDKTDIRKGVTGDLKNA